MPSFQSCCNEEGFLICLDVVALWLPPVADRARMAVVGRSGSPKEVARPARPCVSVATRIHTEYSVPAAVFRESRSRGGGG